MTVTCVNDAPVITSGGTLTYTENAGAVTGARRPSRSPTTRRRSRARRRTSPPASQAGQDSLGWVDNNAGDGITLNAGASDVDTVVLTGSGTPAQYQAALRP